jgi:hypothetical protein
LRRVGEEVVIAVGEGSIPEEEDEDEESEGAEEPALELESESAYCSVLFTAECYPLPQEECGLVQFEGSRFELAGLCLLVRYARVANVDWRVGSRPRGNTNPLFVHIESWEAHRSCLT